MNGQRYVYIAAPLALAHLARSWARRLTNEGWATVVSHWHDLVGDGAVDPPNHAQRSKILEDNLDDLAEAEVVLALMTGGTPRATYCEIGFALGIEIPVVWLGTVNRCIFDAHPLVTVVDDAGVLPALAKPRL